MATGNTEGKGSSGAKFRVPPANVWNNMVDAGNAYALSKLDSPGGPPTRARATDIIKIQNTSGAARRTGEVLKIEGKALDTITAEHIWLLGVEPTADCYFGILKKPVADDGIEQLQVSGVCLALVNVTDVDHDRAYVLDGYYVLQSSSDGPIEILFAPSGTGELSCAVRFAGKRTEYVVILDASLAVATNSKTGATSCLATICVWDVSASDYVETARQITVWNHSESTSHAVDTFGVAREIDGHYLFFGDCNAMASR